MVNIAVKHNNKRRIAMWFVIICLVVGVVIFLVAITPPPPPPVGEMFTDTRDGNVYKTVKIGSQVWMAENLRYKIDGSWCYYNDESNCQKYGRLYVWEAAKKACPSGWHLPTCKEWDNLVEFVGGNDVAGKKLKANSGWDENGNGTNDYGFSARPGGRLVAGGLGIRHHDFGEEGVRGIWWTDAEYKNPYAYIRSMSYARDDVNHYLYEKEEGRGFSVRCVKDVPQVGEPGRHYGEGEFSENSEVDEIETSSFTDTRDGSVYKTVEIGNQVWMAENLRYKIGGSWCYDNDEANCQKYGRLYDWKTARTVCPAGWHLPSREEWQKLVDYAGGDSVAGKKLKSKSGWSGKGNGKDSYGFLALPGGYRYSGGNFNDAGGNGNWWTATEDGGGIAYYRYMYYFNDYVDEYYDDKGNAFSVRCVKDVPQVGEPEDIEEGVFMSNGTPNTSGEHTANEIFLHHHTIVKKLFGCALGIHDKTSPGDKLKAIANCTNMIRMVPVLGYSGRGLSYGGIGEYDRAIADFESMMRLNPNDGLAYNYRGIIYGKKDDFDRAISDFDTSLMLAPSLGDKVYYLRGLAHLGKGNVDRAIADFTQAIEINLSKTPSAEVYLVRGFVYGGKGDVNSAIADFEAALKIEPDNADAKEFLGKIR
jgi:uncharacterized protein (TIGR02145 family)